MTCNICGGKISPDLESVCKRGGYIQRGEITAPELDAVVEFVTEAREILKK